MRIFLDTEFTDVVDCDLISIGLVSDDGRQFYGERNDYKVELCSDFVMKIVVPLLGKCPNDVYNMPALGQALRAWLEEFKDHEPVICFDFVGDIGLMRDVIGNFPPWLKTANVRHRIDKVKFNWYIENCAAGRQHHALYDALASAFAYGESE